MGQNPQKVDGGSQTCLFRLRRTVLGHLHEKTGGKSPSHRARGTDRSPEVSFYVKMQSGRALEPRGDEDGQSDSSPYLVPVPQRLPCPLRTSSAKRWDRNHRNYAGDLKREKQNVLNHS